MFSFRNQNECFVIRPRPPGLVCIWHSWSQYPSYPTGAALDWLKSSRSEYVSIGNTSSQTHPVTCGVPQGSVCVETLFNLYIFGQVVSRFGVFFHVVLTLSYSQNGQYGFFLYITTITCISVYTHCLSGWDKGMDDIEFSSFKQFKNRSHPHSFITTFHHNRFIIFWSGNSIVHFSHQSWSVIWRSSIISITHQSHL